MAVKHHSQYRTEHGELGAAISKAVVGLMAESTGRGPTQARTTIDRDIIVVLLQNTLTRGERYLADSERSEQVQAMRRAYQEAMRSDCGHEPRSAASGRRAHGGRDTSVRLALHANQVVAEDFDC
jgi:hypothetical protein